MTYLLLSILFSSLIFVIFKWMGNKGMPSFPIIVINYLVASIFGFIFGEVSYGFQEILDIKWLWVAILLGISFVFVFNIMAVTTKLYGTSASVVVNKMSLVIPVIFALLFLGDKSNPLKLIGIVLALLGVYLTMKKKDVLFSRLFNKMPIMLFIFSGIIDLSINLIQKNFLGEGEIINFVPFLFLFAFLAGIIRSSFKKSIFTNLFKIRILLTGLVLGIINYFSIYFIFSALAVKDMESSLVFPLNNISIVLLASLLGFILFKERLQTINKVGIVVSVVAILLISFSK